MLCSFCPQPFKQIQLAPPTKYLSLQDHVSLGFIQNNVLKVCHPEQHHSYQQRAC